VRGVLGCGNCWAAFCNEIVFIRSEVVDDLVDSLAIMRASDSLGQLSRRLSCGRNDHGSN
jgi:hypothetical protein